MANERPVSVGYTSTRVGQTVSSSQDVLSDQTSEENLRERRYLWTARNHSRFRINQRTTRVDEHHSVVIP